MPQPSEEELLAAIEQVTRTFYEKLGTYEGRKLICASLVEVMAKNYQSFAHREDWKELMDEIDGQLRVYNLVQSSAAPHELEEFQFVALSACKTGLEQLREKAFHRLNPPKTAWERLDED